MLDNSINTILSDKISVRWLYKVAKNQEYFIKYSDGGTKYDENRDRKKIQWKLLGKALWGKTAFELVLE